MLYLVWARAQRMRFHLPGGDGFMVSLAGGWVLVLLIWRLFDKPSISGPHDHRRDRLGDLRRAAGGRRAGGGGRADARGPPPEPPNPIAEEPEWEVPERRPRERANGRPREHTEVTQVLRERPPAWEGDAPEPPGGRAERSTGGRARGNRGGPRAARGRPPETRRRRPTGSSKRGFSATLPAPPTFHVRMRRALLAPSPSFSSYRPPPKRRRRGRRRGTVSGPFTFVDGLWAGGGLIGWRSEDGEAGRAGGPLR